MLEGEGMKDMPDESEWIRVDRRRNRKNKVPVALRKKMYILTLDISKAFDAVPRSTIIERMIEYGFSFRIIR